jgi:phospholipid/cholesterol/gamma-HCH transport system substrate-binding protein
MNVLLQDFRLHPKRYVSFSVFGKKDKSEPLTKPLEDSLQAPTTSTEKK